MRLANSWMSRSSDNVHRFQIEALEDRVLLAYVPPASPRTDLIISSSWKFHQGDVAGASASSFNDSAWSSVNLPHTWNNLDGQDGGNNYLRGTGWYRKHYTIPTTYSGKQFYLRFDGAFLKTDLYVNGAFVGTHAGGYSGFVFDLNPYVKVGVDNVIAVKVNNQDDLNVAPYWIASRFAPDWTLDGGIYRDVHLLVTKFANVSPLDLGSPGVFLKQTNVSATSANLQITTEVRNSNPASELINVTATIVDAAGNVVKTLTSSVNVAAKSTSNAVQTTTITNPHLWNGTKDPYMYKVYVQLSDAGGLQDLVNQPLGFRFYKVDPNQGFLLNGVKYDLHGVSMNDDRLNKGLATSPSDRTEDVNFLKEIGATGVRLAHYQRAPGTYDRLDSAGLIALTEVAVDGGVTNTTAFTDNVKRQLQELIRQNYNHPSVFFWGVFNELPYTTDSLNLVNTLNNLAHAEDPTRLTIGASNLGTDWQTLAFKVDVTGFNKYYGWYAGKLSDIGPWMDNQHKSNPTRAIGLTEYGAGGSIYQHQLNPTQPTNTGTSWHPEEWENLVHEGFLAAIKTRPFLWGDFAWQLFDSASDFRNQGDTPGRNDKGLVTYDRKTRKDAFYLYKANWSSNPVLYITDRRFTARTVASTEVKIYSNCDSLTLKVNGVQIGSSQAPNFIKVAKWSNVTLQPGANTISITGTKDGVTYTDTCTWTYTPAPAPVAAAKAPATNLFSSTSVRGGDPMTDLI